MERSKAEKFGDQITFFDSKNKQNVDFWSPILPIQPKTP